MKSFLSMILLLVFFAVIPAQKGSVCIEKISSSTEKNVGNPNFTTPVGNKVRIGNKTVSRSAQNIKIGGLNLKEKHTVKVYQDDKQVHSFKFSFADFDSPNLCLFVNDFYGTWQLWELKQKKSCACK